MVSRIFMNDSKNNTLLCIDDDKVILNAVQRIFHEKGYEVLVARDTEQAWQLMATQEVGVILCDYHMPGKDGIQFLNEVKEKYPKTIRLLLTGDKGNELAVQAINRGAVFKFLYKPWDWDELCNVVNEAFQLFNLAKENEYLTSQLTEANEKLSGLNKTLENRIEEKAREITKLTFYNETTALPNKNFLIEWLSHALKRAERDEQMLNVFVLGIDGFKKINGSFGYSIGDELLRMFSERIVSYIRKSDTAFHMSGDLFCVVSEVSDIVSDIPEIVDRFLKKMEDPLCINGEEVYLTASVGISVYPNDGQNAEILLSNAETALNHAKEKGGNTYQYYTDAFNVRARRRLSLEAELRQAIKNEEFILHYQPRVCGSSAKLTAAEALLRWQHPERGLVFPGEFIPLLEETGLIRPVGEWVINEVCATLKRWNELELPSIRLSANLSPVQLKQDDIIAQIRNLTLDPDYAPLLKLLEIEVTESVLVDDIDRAKFVLDLLHNEGITLAIDDFGTGYSALSYLVKLPFDHIKIDISFVSQMGSNPDAASVVRAIIMLARSLRLKSVAEGVETEEHARALRVLGCDEFQGYLYGRPCEESQFMKMFNTTEIEKAADISTLDPGKELDELGQVDLVSNQ